MNMHPKRLQSAESYEGKGRGHWPRRRRDLPFVAAMGLSLLVACQDSTFPSEVGGQGGVDPAATEGTPNGHLGGAPASTGGIGGSPASGGLGGAPASTGGIGGAPAATGGLGGAPASTGGIGGSPAYACKFPPPLGWSTSSDVPPVPDLPDRPAQVTCAPTVAPNETCETDADCTDSASLATVPRHCLPSHECSYDECVRDEDCGATGICSCRGTTFSWGHISLGNVCIHANCRTNADCGEGNTCSATWNTGPFLGIQGYYCRTPQDACTSNRDCCGGGDCRHYGDTGSWECGWISGSG
jgi:hypothetical protein